MFNLVENFGITNAHIANAIITIIILVMIEAMIFVMPHNRRQFFEMDPSLSYYNVDSDVCPPWLLYVISIVVPITCAIFIPIISTYSKSNMISTNHDGKFISRNTFEIIL
jgi:hypothetical protein